MALPGRSRPGSAGWSARSEFSSVAMPDDSIVLMGGTAGGSQVNDTWRSTDKGVTWNEINTSSGWSTRSEFSGVAMPDGSIVLMGGWDIDGSKNDTWQSTDKGVTWNEMNTSSGWTVRSGQSSVAMPDGSIVLTGGYYGPLNYNDTWRSADNGATWTEVNASSGWTARHYHSSVAMPDGSIVLMGGSDANGNTNDMWRSTDDGATWTPINASAGWSARFGHSSVAMPDGSIVLTGGYDGSTRNDVWRLQPAGLSDQNPGHTYTTAGNYTVALQAYNSGGYNSTLKVGYVNVTGSSSLVASFTASSSFGTAPLTVQFNDTSIGSPISWNWSFGDGKLFDAPERDAYLHLSRQLYRQPECDQCRWVEPLCTDELYHGPCSGTTSGLCCQHHFRHSPVTGRVL